MGDSLSYLDNLLILNIFLSETWNFVCVETNREDDH